MLPFLKPEKLASTIIMSKNKAGETTDMHRDDEAPSARRAIAEKMMQAIKDGDANALGMHLEALMAPPPAPEQK